MPPKPEAVVLDSWSMIAYLEDQPAGQQVADIIADAHETDARLMTSVVNLGEVWYITARKTSAAAADRCIYELKELGIESVEADWKLARQAALFKSKYRMSFADCFAAALARRERAQLVTGDREFAQVEREANVRWL